MARPPGAAQLLGQLVRALPEGAAGPAAFLAGAGTAANGVQVVGIALDDIEAANALRAQLQLTYRQLVESDGPPGSAATFGNRIGTLPFSVLIDAQGTVLQVHNGPLLPADLERWAAAARGAP